MSLKKLAQDALNGLLVAPGGSAPLQVSDGTRTLRCDVAEVDALACGFWRLELEDTALAGADVARLQRVAADLARRVTYLLEPIQPIEIDADRCVVQMRSVPPSKDDDGSKYYELLVTRDGALSLTRYGVDPVSGRQPIEAHVTREVFGRLVGDLEAASQA